MVEIADQQDSSLKENVIGRGNITTLESLQDGLNGTRNGSNLDVLHLASESICPSPLEDQEIDWVMVGKGIALSMGQGI